MEYKILLVEDDDLLRLGVKTLLEEDYIIHEATNSQKAIELIEEHNYHLILTDMLMPKGNGEELLKYLVAQNLFIDIIVISALSSDEEILKAYDLNVIDYIVKPINFDILKKKVQNLFQTKYNYKSKAIILNKKEYSISINGNKYELTEKEFEIINLLVSFPNQLFSKYDLLNEVWYGNMRMSEKIVEATISKLRNKLGEDNKIIKTKRGQGYYYEKE